MKSRGKQHSGGRSLKRAPCAMAFALSRKEHPLPPSHSISRVDHSTKAIRYPWGDVMVKMSMLKKNDRPYGLISMAFSTLLTRLLPGLRDRDLYICGADASCREVP